ncbi:hypothetical protein FHW84_002486 [Dyella sp. SG562]|uniref:Bbp16 family capsid cement protein n=1 Tax=Dyella sp. SG562 TaxID=2587017 RepID=UPI0014211948|nr:hypothetical protein [Dyella sp. SG562]NII73913.1 hypothetical protein [Dyella sp. SG562]
MYVDKQTEFSDSQAVTATAISTNVLDIFSTLAGGTTNAAGISPNARIDIGSGPGDLYLMVSTAVTATDTGSDATLTITLESADDAALSTNAQVHFSTPAIAFASFATAGTTLVAIRLPAGLYRRYVGIRYTVASGPLTAGAFDAFLTPATNINRIYASGFTVQ